MSKHEPECWIVSHSNPLNGCICTELRACQKRVAAHLEADRLRTERDQAREIAVALEQEIAQCQDGYWWHQQQGTADRG